METTTNEIAKKTSILDVKITAENRIPIISVINQVVIQVVVFVVNVTVDAARVFVFNVQYFFLKNERFSMTADRLQAIGLNSFQSSINRVTEIIPFKLFFMEKRVRDHHSIFEICEHMADAIESFKQEIIIITMVLLIFLHRQTN